MRIALPAVLIVCFAASPAFATQGLRCAPAAGTGPVVSLTIGSGAGPAVVGASLADGKTVRSTRGDRPAIAIGQSWVDSQRVWLDLTDANAMRYEARLRAQFAPKLRGRPALGTLVRNGRTWRVRCVEA